MYLVNEELSEKLNSEIGIEQENQEEESSARQQLEEYIHRSEYQIDAPEGEEEVVLHRTYGDEKLVPMCKEAVHNTDSAQG